MNSTDSCWNVRRNQLLSNGELCGDDKVMHDMKVTFTASVFACMTCASSCHGCLCGGALPPVDTRAMYASIRARLPASSIRSIACHQFDRHAC